MSSEVVELGFVEKRASWKLRSKFFPSKVGGMPAWLSLNNLPSHMDLKCKICHSPYVFLMQIYAPIVDVENAFHRTVFIFMCPNGKCSKRFNSDNFAVFRSQLPRKNEFYSFDPPVENEKTASLPCASQFQKLCDICGCSTTLSCEKCTERSYCSENHRTCDWEWFHKDICCQENKSSKKKLKNRFLLPEYELVTDAEQLPPETPEKSDEEKMKEYRQFMQSLKAPNELQDMPLDDLDTIMKKNDKVFNKFQKRIKHEPEQVLRYHRGGVPLWVSSEHIPSEIPPCVCGAKRIFEFQVMPQLLNYLSLDAVEDSIDWGTLIVYTCSKNCGEGTAAYVQEYLWKQDFSDCQQ